MTEILKMGERAGLGMALAGLALCAGCPTAANNPDPGNDDGNAGDVP